MSTGRFALLCPGQGGQHGAMFDAARPAGIGLSGALRNALAASLDARFDATLMDASVSSDKAHRRRPHPPPSPADAGEGTNSALRRNDQSAGPAPSPTSVGEGWGEGAFVVNPKNFSHSPLTAILADDTRLFANRNAQPLIVAAGLAAWTALRDVLPTPHLLAGYSVGELTAWAIAGAFDPAFDPTTALRLATARACAMDDAARAVPQGLLAVSGLPWARLCALAGPDLYPAIVNADQAGVLGGRRADLDAAATRLIAAGARVTPLPVGVAAHTPLMAAALASFRAALDMTLDASAPGDARIPVCAGVGGAPLRAIRDGRDALLGQLVSTVRWDACMRQIAEAGITVALEIGPGNALARMLADAYPHIEARSVDDFRGAAGIARWVAGRL